ncbi:hypothetical protein [Pseudomonas amygdali]|nr:hypothetical protein [Pseudomonas amygdali]
MSITLEHIVALQHNQLNTLPREPLIYSIFRPGNALEALIYLGATAGF